MFIIVQPHVDFGLKLVGADLMSIPGAYRIVQVKNLSFLLFCLPSYPNFLRHKIADFHLPLILKGEWSLSCIINNFPL